MNMKVFTAISASAILASAGQAATFVDLTQDSGQTAIINQQGSSPFELRIDIVIDPDGGVTSFAFTDDEDISTSIIGDQEVNTNTDKEIVENFGFGATSGSVTQGFSDAEIKVNFRARNGNRNIFLSDENDWRGLGIHGGNSFRIDWNGTDERETMELTFDLTDAAFEGFKLVVTSVTIGNSSNPDVQITDFKLTTSNFGGGADNIITTSGTGFELIGGNSGVLGFAQGSHGGGDRQGYQLRGFSFDVVSLEPEPVPVLSFQDWLDIQFPDEEDRTNPELIGRMATPAGDGLSNLLKYAFGFAPLTPIAGADLPEPKVEDGLLMLTYRERVGATEISYLPEKSFNLIDWDFEGIQRLSPAEPDGEFESVTIQLELNDETKAFLRIQVIDLLDGPGEDRDWTNGDGDRFWNKSGNWNNGVPRDVDKAAIRNSSVAAALIQTGIDAVANVMVVGDWGHSGGLEMTGGSLTTNGWIILGYGPGDYGTFDLSGGTVTTGGNMIIGLSGVGILNMTGGSATVGGSLVIAQDPGSAGGVFLGGGTINAGGINMTSGGSLGIQGGTLIVDGNVTTTINSYVTNGWITAYEGSGTVQVDYNISNSGKTTVWAEPSPTNDYSQTLTGKIMSGYQGWFNAPGDGANRGWVHWGRSNRFEPGYCTVDWWPDMSEMDEDEKFPTGFQYADGSTAYVFSSYNRKTVLRHFEWMEDYGLDGVFLQRFASETVPGSNALNHRDQVMLHVREGANLHRRAWAMMYDLSSGMSGPQLKQRVIDDWKHLVDTYGLTRTRFDEAYLHHNGKPVVAVWGLGFQRPYEGQDTYDIINFLKNDPFYGGLTVMIGVGNDWLSLKDTDYWFGKIVDLADIISPWNVGRYGSIHESQLNNFTLNRTIPEQNWCDLNGKDYLPVVFPGFSWQNLYDRQWDHIPRLGGNFLWRQYYKKINAGATMIYQAMFDEVDEGTQIFKATSNPPIAEFPTSVASHPFLPIGNTQFAPYDSNDASLPSDHYLWLVGQGTKMLRGEIPLSEALPSR